MTTSRMLDAAVDDTVDSAAPTRSFTITKRLALATALSGAVGAFVATRIGSPMQYVNVIYGMLAAGVLVMGAGIVVHRPPRKSGWRPYFVGHVIMLLALIAQIGPYVGWPVPTVPLRYTQAAIMAGNALVVWGVLRLAVIGVRGVSKELALDGLLVSWGLAPVIWMFVLGPRVGELGTDPMFVAFNWHNIVAIFVTAIYGVRILAARDSSRAVRLYFGVGQLAALVYNGAVIFEPRLSEGRHGAIGVAFGAACWMWTAAAMMHPTMRDVGTRIVPRETRFGPLRATALIVALLLAPMLALLDGGQRSRLDVVVLSVSHVGMALLVLTRVLLAIRQRDRARVELHRSEQRLFSLVEHASDAIVVFDADGTMRFASPSLRDLSGVGPDDAQGQDFRSLVHRDDLGEVEQSLGELLAEPQGYIRLEFRTVVTRRGESEVRWLEGRLANRLDDPAVGGVVANLHDVTERKSDEATLTKMALHDSLTGLPNRTLLLDRVRHALARSERTPTSVGLLFIDLDRFKPVNDTYGHDVGDHVLTEIGRRIEAGCRTGDTVARIGGDEFVVLCEGLLSQEEAHVVAERVGTSVARPIAFNSLSLELGSSIGISFPAPGDTAEDLIHNADLAMYRAKNERTGGYAVYGEGVSALHEELAGQVEPA